MEKLDFSRRGKAPCPRRMMLREWLDPRNWTRRRKIALGIVGLFCAFMIFVQWEYGRGKRMAEAAVELAKSGAPLDGLLSDLAEKGYRIRVRHFAPSAPIMVIPKRGFGKYYCSLEHTGARVISAGVRETDGLFPFNKIRRLIFL